MKWTLAALSLGLPLLGLAARFELPPIQAGGPELELRGHPVQGGLVQGRVAPGTAVIADGEPVLVDGEGTFLVGLGRDRSEPLELELRPPGRTPTVTVLPVRPREFAIERIDGLPPAQVTPPAEVLERIRREARAVARARARRDHRRDFDSGFVWPARGRISGVYGSQRILNGEPRRPHYGVDVAAPEGAPVVAPADGIVTLAAPDLYYSGGTIIIDHGLGLSSTFLHLSEVAVDVGERVAQGARIGSVGATGRATGPHLDWRMNAGTVRIDPELLVSGPPAP